MERVGRKEAARTPENLLLRPDWLRKIGVDSVNNGNVWHGAQARGGGAGRVLIWCVAQQRLTAVVNKRASSCLMAIADDEARGMLLCTHGMKRSIPPIPQWNWIDPVDSNHQFINRPGSGRGTCAGPFPAAVPLGCMCVGVEASLEASGELGE